MALAHPRLRAKRDALRAALPGHVRPHHRVLLRQHLRVVDTLQATIGELDAAIGAALAPCHAAVAHLVTIPGVSTTAAQILVAEIGTDMTRFPSVGHLISWAGLCPRQDAARASTARPDSARGRRGSSPSSFKARWAAVRGRDGYLRAQFFRLKSRCGPMKAIVAVAASMLTAAYYMLRDDRDYHDLGAAHFHRIDHDRLVAGLTRRLHHLGYEATLRPAA